MSSGFVNARKFLAKYLITWYVLLLFLILGLGVLTGFYLVNRSSFQFEVSIFELLVLVVVVVVLALSLSGLMTSKTKLRSLQEYIDCLEEQNKMLQTMSRELELDIESINLATKELATSNEDISKSTNEATTMSAKTVKQSEGSKDIVKNLNDKSSEIGEILEVVSSVTQQVNILAINAAIEAARAGESGKGFAVVANEIKELANQTKKATIDISSNIHAIQSELDKALGAIVSTTDSVKSNDNISRKIAVSVETQNVYNQEILLSIDNAKKKLQQFSQQL